ncbi:MAG TPA: Ig-like domain-containing protein, partial [Solirubrobacteraceae bacterium]|nr:Ig-like domain-containing protein [Solirubrobacteraceae bacterium]
MQRRRELLGAGPLARTSSGAQSGQVRGRAPGLRARARKRWGCAGVLFALALAAAQPAAAASAIVLEGFPGGSTTNDPTPSFSGTSEDHLDAVTVDLFAGESPSGAPLEVLTSQPSGASGSWSVAATNPLADGTYTALAEQHEPGAPPSASAPYVFTLDTRPPTVALAAPALFSGDTTPTFSGTASDTTAVSVNVYSGGRAEGIPLVTLEANPVGGRWSSAGVSPPLLSGTYTVIATQPSSLGNPSGTSEAATFVVEAGAPSVTLDAPPARSNDTLPSFSGTASEATPVTVEVFEGPRAQGALAAIARTTATPGSWSTEPLETPLPEGRHTFTAVALQASEHGKPPGESGPVSFIVDTEPPEVRLDDVPSPSNDTKPSFSGT